MRFGGMCLLVVVWSWSTHVIAQAPASEGHAFQEEARRSQLHEQNIAAGVLHLASAALATWTLMGGIYVIGASGAAYCSSCDHSGEQTFVLGSLYAGAAAGVLMIIGLVLNVDHHIRLREIERSRAGARIVPGPGDLGMGVAFALETS